MRLRTKYRIDTEYGISGTLYYVPQYQLWWWPFWINIKSNLLFTSDLHHWCNSESQAKEVCKAHSIGYRWYPKPKSPSEFPKYLDL